MNKADVLQGTLDLMVIKTLDSMGSIHGYGIARRLLQISDERVATQPGDALSGTPAPRTARLDLVEVGRIREQPARPLLRAHPRRAQQLQREADDWHRMAGIMARVLGGARRRHDAARGVRAYVGRARRGATARARTAGRAGFHREMLEEAPIASAGLDAGRGPARRGARALGGGAQIAEAWRDQRSLPFLDMLLQDLRYGVRVLRRTPGFTARRTPDAGARHRRQHRDLSRSVDAVLLRPLPYAEPDRLVTIGDRDADGVSSNVGFATVARLARERSRSFESLAMMRSWQPTLVANGEAERLPAVRVSWNYFDMLGVRPALGRDFHRLTIDRPNTGACCC